MVCHILCLLLHLSHELNPSQCIVQQALWSPVLPLIAFFIAVMDPLQTLLHSIIHVSAVSTLIAPSWGSYVLQCETKLPTDILKWCVWGCSGPQNDPVWANMPVDVWISLKDGLLTGLLILLQKSCAWGWQSDTDWEITTHSCLLARSPMILEIFIWCIVI